VIQPRGWLWVEKRLGEAAAILMISRRLKSCTERFFGDYNDIRTRRRGYCLPCPADLSQFFQQRSETYAWTREWLPSCVRMIREGPLFFGGA
jgi:hypothetical protein